MSLYEALDRLVDAVYDNVDLLTVRSLRKPVADALRALRHVDRGASAAVPPAATMMRGVIHRAEVAKDDWRLLLSCGHTINIKSNSRHQHVPGVGKLVKCWACRGPKPGAPEVAP